jgi:predicted nucleic acid-binding protein
MKTTQIVIDASVALALVLDEPESASIRAAVADWLDRDAQLLAPDHFWLEVINPLARRHGYESRRLIEVVSYLETLPIRTIETVRPQIVLTMGLMDRFGLTAYDAVYVALAQTLSARLATTDEVMLRAADDLGLDPRLGPDEAATHRLSEMRAPYGSDPVQADERPVTWPAWPGAWAYLGTLRRQALAER